MSEQWIEVIILIAVSWTALMLTVTFLFNNLSK